MSEAKGQNEPSMEEILASIRRIIAEDGDAAPASTAAEEKPPTSRQDDVLELTEVVEEDGTVVSITAGGPKPGAGPAKREASESALSLDPEPPEPAQPPRSRPEPEPEEIEARPGMADDTGERLVSGATAAASVAALSQLSAIGQDRIDSMPLGDAGRTLEDLVRELLRPMLRQWLDANLPHLVERLVQDEIKRMTREAQGR